MRWNLTAPVYDLKSRFTFPLYLMRWLQTLHEQWMSARKRRVTASVRSFRREWEDLLDDAGLKSAEDRQTALREAERIPQFKLHRLKGRPHIVLKIEVPLESEAWLHAQFGSKAGAEVQSAAQEVVGHWATKTHPLLPEAWGVLTSRLKTEFAIPRAVEPFRWLETERLNELLSLLYALTSREWPEGTLIRDASTQISQDSKCLQLVSWCGEFETHPTWRDKISPHQCTT